MRGKALQTAAPITDHGAIPGGRRRKAVSRTQLEPEYRALPIERIYVSAAIAQKLVRPDDSDGHLIDVIGILAIAVDLLIASEAARPADGAQLPPPVARNVCLLGRRYSIHELSG
jgi:hypothetical protein